jgi:hypothetical protein
MYPQAVFEPSRLMDLVASEKITVPPADVVPDAARLAEGR